MRPTSLVDVFVAFALGFLAGGGELPNVGLPAWVWPIGVKAPFVTTEPIAVLVVEESTPGDNSNAPVWVNSTKAGGVRDYVENTRKGKFRLLDQHNPTDLANQDWKDALAVKRDKVPWIVAAGQRSGVSQALPATAAETLKLLEGVK